VTHHEQGPAMDWPDAAAPCCMPSPSCVRLPPWPTAQSGPSPCGSPKSGAGGLQRRGASPGSAARAARGRSTSAPAFRTSPADISPSRAAVTGATSSRRPEPAGVDGERGSQSPPSLARTATPSNRPLNADIRTTHEVKSAVNAPNPASASRTSDHSSSRAAHHTPSHVTQAPINQREEGSPSKCLPLSSQRPPHGQVGSCLSTNER
jgi:hypothetical protein